MSMKRNKWKFSPARRRRPVVRAYSVLEKEDEILIPDEEGAAVSEVPEIDEEGAAAPEVPEIDKEAAAVPEVPEIDEEGAAVPEVPEIDKEAAAAPEVPEIDEEGAAASDAAESIEENAAAAETILKKPEFIADVPSEASEEPQFIPAEPEAIPAEPVSSIPEEPKLIPAEPEAIPAEPVSSIPEEPKLIPAEPEAIPAEPVSSIPEEPKLIPAEPEAIPAEPVSSIPAEPQFIPAEPEAIPAEPKSSNQAETESSIPAESFGEETAAAQELPDYFFDEEEEMEEEFSEGSAEEPAGMHDGSDVDFDDEFDDLDDDFEDNLDDFDSESDPDEDFEGDFNGDPDEDFDRDFNGRAFNGDPDDGFENDPDDELERDIKDEVLPSLYERGSSGKKRNRRKDAGKSKKDRDKRFVRKTVRLGDIIIGDGTPKICVPITGRGKDEIVSQAIDAIAVSPDLVEWRVDYLEEAGGKKDIIDILTALRRILRDTPLLFTYRTEGEGGYGRVGWSHYAELLEWAACRPEIDIIDVEAMGLDVDTEGLIRVIHGRGTPVIASVHYCGEMPGKKERKEAIRFLKQSGGDIIKVAVTPQNEEDVLELMVWTRKVSRKMEQPLITMAMGNLGKVSRVSGRLTGSAVTFGAVGEMSAPGQIPAAELRSILKQI